MTNPYTDLPPAQPGKSHQLHGLDHLRALAITMVFFCHYNLGIFGHPGWLSYARFGWTGVDLFFVLSGFLISSQLFAAIKAGKGVNYKVFFIKRFFRIVPAFFAVVALYYFIPAFRERPTVPPLSRLLTFTHNLGLRVHEYGAFSHSWSLCVEEHFYIALPLVLMALHKLNLLKTGPWFIAVLFIGGFIMRQYAWAHYCAPQIDPDTRTGIWFTNIYYPTYTRLDGLLTGVSIAALYTFAPRLWHQLSKHANLFIVFALLVLAVAYFKCADPTYNTSTFGFPLISIAYGALVIAAVSPVSILYKWRSKATALIASLSYGIYLLHKGVIHMTQSAAGRLGLDANGIVMMLLCMASCVIIALIMYRLIERPFMKARDRILHGSAARSTATVAGAAIGPGADDNVSANAPA